MCRVLKVHRSGYYAWKACPKSARTLADEALIIDIKQFFEDSHGIYGSPRIHHDLREAGTRCGVKRVARLMRQVRIKSVRGYKRPRHKAGKPDVAAPNRLEQQFTFTEPDVAWVTDISVPQQAA
jgi:putative transposase